MSTRFGPLDEPGSKSFPARTIPSNQAVPNSHEEISFPILFAEDNEDDAMVWSGALKKAGVKDGPFVVRDGAEAIDYLAGNGIYADRRRYPFPLLMLLDLNMPRRDGFDVLNWWRSAARTVHLTIVVLTGSDMEREIDLAYELGAASHLKKPADVSKVEKMARLALDFWQISQTQQPPSSR